MRLVELRDWLQAGRVSSFAVYWAPLLIAAFSAPRTDVTRLVAWSVWLFVAVWSGYVDHNRRDVRRDRNSPRKQHHPLAAGRLTWDRMRGVWSLGVAVTVGYPLFDLVALPTVGATGLGLWFLFCFVAFAWGYNLSDRTSHLRHLLYIGHWVSLLGVVYLAFGGSPTDAVLWYLLGAGALYVTPQKLVTAQLKDLDTDDVTALDPLGSSAEPLEGDVVRYDVSHATRAFAGAFHVALVLVGYYWYATHHSGLPWELGAWVGLATVALGGQLLTGTTSRKTRMAVSVVQTLGSAYVIVASLATHLTGTERLVIYVAPLLVTLPLVWVVWGGDLNLAV